MDKAFAASWLKDDLPVQLKLSKADKEAAAAKRAEQQEEAGVSPRGSELGITEDLRPAALVRSVCSLTLSLSDARCLEFPLAEVSAGTGDDAALGSCTIRHAGKQG